VLAENIQQALVFVRTGNADAAIVARSLLAADEACSTPIDPSMHQPIPQAAAVLANATDKARARSIVGLLVDPKNQALLVRGGFALPGSG
jgi:molybdate transport system substrate-binding protein